MCHCPLVASSLLFAFFFPLLFSFRPTQVRLLTGTKRKACKHTYMQLTMYVSYASHRCACSDVLGSDSGRAVAQLRKEFSFPPPLLFIPSVQYANTLICPLDTLIELPVRCASRCYLFLLAHSVSLSLSLLSLPLLFSSKERMRKNGFLVGCIHAGVDFSVEPICCSHRLRLSPPIAIYMHLLCLCVWQLKGGGHFSSADAVAAATYHLSDRVCADNSSLL